MSAIVYILDSERGYMSRQVPAANHAEVTSAGHLQLSTTSYGQHAGLFKQWDHVVITPDRGPDGRFIKKG
jgi:hypothetical protein